jgi:hypothetical protein
MSEARGYAVMEGTPVEVYKELQKLNLSFKNEMHEV